MRGAARLTREIRPGPTLSVQRPSVNRKHWSFAAGVLAPNSPCRAAVAPGEAGAQSDLGMVPPGSLGSPPAERLAAEPRRWGPSEVPGVSTRLGTSSVRGAVGCRVARRHRAPWAREEERRGARRRSRHIRRRFRAMLLGFCRPGVIRRVAGERGHGSPPTSPWSGHSHAAPGPRVEPGGIGRGLRPPSDIHRFGRERRAQPVAD